jgi:DNA polymerase I-like protein with 3'-5' exonuclease and polymerase domains
MTKKKIKKFDFPDLSAADMIAVDLETRDDELMQKGPGVRRGGYILGVALATGDGYGEYYPFGHDSGQQLDRDVVLKYCREQLGRKDQPKVGANILYDLDYLAEAGVKAEGPFYDVQVAEPLLDENRIFYNLDSLGEQYLGEGKEDTGLEEWCEDHGIKTTKTNKPQAHLWKMPADVVSPYAIGDVDRTIRVIRRQLPLIEAQGLRPVFDLETSLIPCLLDMRRQGVRVNVEAVAKTANKFRGEEELYLSQMRKMVGFEVDIWAADSIAKAFDKLKLKYPRTPKSDKPSFTRPWLERHGHPFAQLLLELRKLDKFCGTFLEGQILGTVLGDRIHTQFNQLRGTDYGTVTGRFSSSMPNLQFIPNRDPVLGPLCRSFFLPEVGMDWGRADYSQVEIRILAHYGMGRGSADLVDAYNNDRSLDYHQWCANKAKITRKAAKAINFGIIYGMGVDKLCHELGLERKEGEVFLKEYHAELPFLKNTIRMAARTAEGRGYVKTLLNRRRRFDTWEARDWKLARSPGAFTSRDKQEVIDWVLQQRKEIKALGVSEKAPLPYPGARRAGTYKAFNAVDQGTAADIMKKSMADCYKAGIFDVCPAHLTVHDEIDVSVPKTKVAREAFKEMKRLMEAVIKLKVPLTVDASLGKNWGEKEIPQPRPLNLDK